MSKPKTAPQFARSGDSRKLSRDGKLLLINGKKPEEPETTTTGKPVAASRPPAKSSK